MGLMYAKSIKNAKQKLVAQLQSRKEAENYEVKASKLKSEEKGYKLYKVNKKR